VRDIGLQLSFLAVVGIGWAAFLSRPYQRSAGKWRWLVSSVLVSLGATLFTWPLISYYFGLISLSAVAANLLILPAVPVIMVGSMIAVAASYIWELGGYLAALPVHAAAWWMITIAKILGSMPGTWLSLTVSRWFLASYYICLVALTLVIVRWQKRRWREVWE